jgi:hypothetical protein
MGFSTEDFTRNELYIGRINKAGQQMARDNNGKWQYVTNTKLSTVRLDRWMEIVEQYEVQNHKEAQMQLLIYDTEQEQVIRTSAWELVQSVLNKS